MKQSKYLWPVTAAATLAAAVAAFAHGGSGVVDIELIEERIDQRVLATFGRERKAYAALARVVNRRTHTAAADVAKLAAVEKACRGALAADTVLYAALADPEADLDAYLDRSPANIASAAGRLERPTDRAAVQRTIDAATALHVAGRTRRDAGDEAGMLAKYRVSAAKFTAADRMAGKLLARQVRRGAPGQPLVKGPKGTIDTYAGTGLTSSGPEGAPALDSNLYFPMDVSLDPATGLVHVCDYNDHRIRRIDADGRMRTVLRSNLFEPTGPGLSIYLDHPSGLTFHPVTGDLWVAGWHTQSIVRVTATAADVVGGTVAGDAGDEGPVADATFNYPSCVCFDSAGGWYVADQDNQRIRYVDPQGRVHAFAGTAGQAGFSGDGGQASAATFSFPSGAPAGRVCLSPDERWLYVADTGNRSIRRIELATGVISFVAGDPVPSVPPNGTELVSPVDVDCDADGNVYVCDLGSNSVRRVNPLTGASVLVAGLPGQQGYSGDRGAATSARLRQPSGIHVDRVRGRLYVADTGNNVVRVVWE